MGWNIMERTKSKVWNKCKVYFCVKWYMCTARYIQKGVESTDERPKGHEDEHRGPYLWYMIKWFSGSQNGGNLI